jgi:hypothetical protein
MDSWTLSERTYDSQKSFYSHGGSFDQISGMYTDNSLISNNAIPISNIEQYNEYAWLFGKSK